MKIEITVSGKIIEAEVNEEDLKELIEDEKEVSDVLWRAEKIEITVNGETIEAYVKDKDIKELIEDEKEVPDVLWRAKKGEKYLSIYANGTVGAEEEDNYEYDNDFWELGNYYRTVEEANKEIEKRKAIMRIRRYATEKWGEFVPDWNDNTQAKFFMAYCHGIKRFDYSNYSNTQQETFMYFEKSEHIDEVIKKFDLDLKLIFNIK